MSAFCKWLHSLFSKPDPEPIIYNDPIVAPDPIPVPEPIPEPIPEPEPAPPTPEPEPIPDPTPEPVTANYAFLVGINKQEEPGYDLLGCVNDVNNMREVLVNTFGFEVEDMELITNEDATKANIIAGLERLVAKGKPGDELVFHYSGHGSQVVDMNNDELNDYLDEILCPYDLDWNDPLSDDIIGSIFDKIEEGVSLTFICDACNSGTMTRNSPGRDPKEIKRQKFRPPPEEIRKRDIGNLPLRKIGMKSRSLNHALLSGCRDDQYSSDAYIDGQYQGALTYSVIKAINNDPDRTCSAIHSEVLIILVNGGFDQEPQLSGSSKLIEGRNIFGGTN